MGDVAPDISPFGAQNCAEFVVVPWQLSTSNRRIQRCDFLAGENLFVFINRKTKLGDTILESMLGRERTDQIMHVSVMCPLDPWFALKGILCNSSVDMS